MVRRYCHNCGSNDVSTKGAMAAMCVKVTCNDCGSQDTRQAFEA